MPEQPEESPLDSIRVYMSLERLGELAAAVACDFARMREIERPDLLGEEGRQIAKSAWQYVRHMADRADFEASVEADLANLETSDADGTE